MKSIFPLWVVLLLWVYDVWAKLQLEERENILYLLVVSFRPHVRTRLQQRLLQFLEEKHSALKLLVAIEKDIAHDRNHSEVSTPV